jgi:glycosyltransferase involved in cell wall biosynthesis
MITGKSGKLDICMLLPPNYRSEMEHTEIEVFSRLAKWGHRVSWILCSEKFKRPNQTISNDITVHTVPHLPGQLDFSLRYGFRIIPYEIRRLLYILKTIKNGNYNLIFIESGLGVLDRFLAPYFKKRYGIPFAYYLSSPLEHQLQSYRIERKKPKLIFYLIAKLNAAQQLFAMRRAVLILPISLLCGKSLVEKGIKPSSILTLPSGINTDSFNPKNIRKCREANRLGNAKILLYIGTLAKVRNLSVLLKAFARVKERSQNVKFMIVGDGSDKDNLEELAKKLGIQNDIVFTGWIHHHELPDYISASDICLSPIPPLSFYEVSSPTKMFEYMAMAKPVIANEEIAEHKEVLNKSGAGILVPFTPEGFASAIIELLDRFSEAIEMGERGRDWVLKNVSHEVLARQVEEKLVKLILESKRTSSK